MKRIYEWLADGGFFVVGIAALIVFAIILARDPIIARSRITSPTPSGKLTITTPGSGLRDVTAGAQDVSFGEICFTADATNDIFIERVTVTDVVSTADSVDNPFKRQILQNLELWADLTPADSWRKDRFETKVTDAIQYSDTFMVLTARFTFTLSQELKVPAGETIDVLLIGDVPPNAIPGSSHFVKPGDLPRYNCAVAATTDGEKVAINWDMATYPKWPELNTITIVAQPNASKP